MKKLLLIISLFLSIQAKAGPTLLTPEEKAFLYHVIMKSPVLKRNLSDLVHFKGDSIIYKNKVIYDDIEEQIIYEPSLLELNIQGFGNVSPGLLSELATKMALYALQNELSQSIPKTNTLHTDRIFKLFMDKLLQSLPENATRIRNQELEVLPKILKLFNPGFSMNEKIAFINSIGIYSVQDQQQILNAYHKSIDLYTQEKALDYFLMLGGENLDFQNTLLAAGDGSGTAGLLREKDNGKPKGIGLFTYQTEISTIPNQIQIIQTPEKSFQLLGNKRTTNLHLSIWGFNSKNQTTVVIKNDSVSYVLFANNLTKELSPDTTFSGGKTYFTLLEEVQDKIDLLNEKTKGSSGLLNRIITINNTLLEANLTIDKNQEAIADIKKSSSKSKKKKIAKHQDKIARSNHKKRLYQKKLEKAEFDLKVVKEKQLKWEGELKKMKSNLGEKQLSFKKIGDVFLFEDGSIFNAITQDFKFSDETSNDKFTIKLIAIGNAPMAKKVDEVQLHINVTEGKTIDKFFNEFELKLKDEFKSDCFALSDFSLDEFQKFQLRRIALKMSLPATTTYASIRGNGIGIKTKNGIEPSKMDDIDSYPGNNQADKKKMKESKMFSDLRVSNIHIYFLDSNLYIDINSYTDPVKSNIHKKEELNYLFRSNNVTGNEVLSALRSYYLFQEILNRIKMQCVQSLPKKSQEICLERIKKLKTQINVSCNGKMEFDHSIFEQFSRN